jgi:hypothetical protein
MKKLSVVITANNKIMEWDALRGVSVLYWYMPNIKRFAKA